MATLDASQQIDELKRTLAHDKAKLDEKKRAERHAHEDIAKSDKKIAEFEAETAKIEAVIKKSQEALKDIEKKHVTLGNETAVLRRKAQTLTGEVRTMEEKMARDVAALRELQK